MTTIVLNTATGAVSEYDWSFNSLSADFAGDASALYALAGDTDYTLPIASEIRGGTPGGDVVNVLGNVYVAVDGPGELIVVGRTSTWFYPVEPRGSGIARAKPGKGIAESYLGFGYRNTDGADFRLTRIDAEVAPKKTRRN
jgi:hypothetical protein